jgi:hypothetical protein
MESGEEEKRRRTEQEMEGNKRIMFFLRSKAGRLVDLLSPANISFLVEIEALIPDNQWLGVSQ